MDDGTDRVDGSRWIPYRYLHYYCIHYITYVLHTLSYTLRTFHMFKSYVLLYEFFVTDIRKGYLLFISVNRNEVDS